MSAPSPSQPPSASTKRPVIKTGPVTASLPPKKERKPPPTGPIAENRRARYEYHIEETYEAGIVLEGWEVKAARAGQVQLTDGYVHVRNGELFIIGCRIQALRTASTHVNPMAERTRKLLMHKDEIKRLVGKIEQKGFTLVPLNLHYKGSRVKVDVALAKGKAQHDKRDTEKKRDWEREKGRLMRHKVSGPSKA